MRGFVYQLNVSSGGVPKKRVEVAEVTETGVSGDRQANTRLHGGPERAVCLFSLERIEAMRAEGHPIEPGSTGENITVRGIDWELLEPGKRLRIGHEVVLEITLYTNPCKNIAGSVADGDFSRLDVAKHPGQSRLYARVITPGTVHTSDPIEVMPAGPGVPLS